MKTKDFKPLTVEDFNLSPQELAEIVEGAQTFLSPVEEDAIDTTAD